MKILVVSDSHGNESLFDSVVCKEIDGLKFLFFLGDGENDFIRVREYHPTLSFAAVRGNCDLFSTLNISDLISVGGKRIFYSHGHTFGVKNGTESIKARAVTLGADVLLFGHTHCPYMKNEDGLFIMNPGALKDMRYGIITIENGEIKGELKKI